MTEQSPVPGAIDVTRPNVARMYDYYLGGKDNFEVDREAAERVLAAAPHTPALARQNRAFLERAVRYLGERGVDQFLDIGAGLPTRRNVHEVVRDAVPGGRVVYVDNDPVVLSHGRALLDGALDAGYVAGDVRRPADLLAEAGLDLSRPVGLLLLAVLHCVPDAEDPWAAVRELRDALAPGSHLVLSHITDAELPASARAGADVYRKASSTMTLRDRDAITRFFDGFTLVEPGVVPLPDWRPAGAGREDLPTWFLCGVGRRD
ncbi:SAM-dependent methyltransferase [Actinomadura kijaniata]|uniref:SAM-dependent methyltransferase n=1 Tax=Actinomadura kijaniata TaxID=46161 RepID=UPI003F193D78